MWRRTMCRASTPSPANVLPLTCAALSCETSSDESNPAFSEIMAGSWRRARANASIAIAFLPGVFFASSSTAMDISVSHAPPPHTTRGSLETTDRTQSASWSDLAAWHVSGSRGDGW